MKAFKKGVLASYIDSFQANELEVELKKLPLHPTTSTTHMTMGFVNVDHDFSIKGNFIFKLNDEYVSTFCIENRSANSLQVTILFQKKLKEKMKDLGEGEIVTQKVKRALQKEARTELTAKADPTQHYIHVAWNLKANEVIIDSTNKKELDLLFDTLAKAGINLQLEKVHFDIEGFLAQVIDKPSEALSDDFDVGKSVEMKDDTSEKATVAYKNQDIINSEIETNRHQNKQPQKVGMIHNDSIEFSLDLNHSVTAIRLNNADHSYYQKALEEIKEIELNEPEKTAYFQKMGIMLMLNRNIFNDLIKMRENCDEITQYVVTPDNN